MQSDSHGPKYKFEVIEKDGHYVQLDVSSNMSIEFLHEPRDNPFTQIRGQKRKQFFKLSKYRTSRKLYWDDCRENYEEYYEKNYTDKKIKMSTVENIVSEGKVANRKKLKLLDLWNVMQQWLDDDIFQVKFVREFKLLLSIILFTEK